MWVNGYFCTITFAPPGKDWELKAGKKVSIMGHRKRKALRAEFDLRVKEESGVTTDEDREYMEMALELARIQLDICQQKTAQKKLEMQAMQMLDGQIKAIHAAGDVSADLLTAQPTKPFRRWCSLPTELRCSTAMNSDPKSFTLLDMHSLPSLRPRPPRLHRSQFVGIGWPNGPLSQTPSAGSPRSRSAARSSRIRRAPASLATTQRAQVKARRPTITSRPTP